MKSSAIASWYTDAVICGKIPKNIFRQQLQFHELFWRKVWKTFFIQHQLDNDDEEKVDEEKSAKNIHIA